MHPPRPSQTKPDSDPSGFDRRAQELLNQMVEEQSRQIQREFARVSATLSLQGIELEAPTALQSLRNAGQARAVDPHAVDNHSNGNGSADDCDNQRGGQQQQQSQPTEPPPYEDEDGEGEVPPPYTDSYGDHLIERGPHLAQVGPFLLERGNEVFPPPDYSQSNVEESDRRPLYLRLRDVDPTLDPSRQRMSVHRDVLHPAAAPSTSYFSPSGLDRMSRARQDAANLRRCRVWGDMQGDGDPDISRRVDGRAPLIPRLSFDGSAGWERSAVGRESALPFPPPFRPWIGQPRLSAARDQQSYAERAGLFDYPGRRRRSGQEDNRGAARDLECFEGVGISGWRETRRSDDNDERYQAERAELFQTRRRNPEVPERDGRQEREQRHQ